MKIRFLNGAILSAALLCIVPPAMAGGEEGYGDEGCTPGYWKQPQHFDSWVGYSPDDDYCDTFGLTTCPEQLVDLTLLDALRQGGGGWAALGRHSVAALLSAKSLDYPYSKWDVLTMVSAADLFGVETTKDLLDEANNLGCPLN